MRHSVVFPALCAFVALILSLLCVFAGSKPGMLETYDIITINTSNITVSKMKGLGGEIFRPVDEGLDSAAKELGLHDFYSVYMLDFCEGYFQADSSKEAVTYCSPMRSFFTWNATATIQGELNEHISLGDIDWPGASIDKGIHDLALAFHVVYVIYCMGILMTGLTLLASTYTIFHHRRLFALVNMSMAAAATFLLMLASAIVTGASHTAAAKISQYGADINVTATEGKKLFALTWAATILMLITSAAWFLEFFLFKRMESKMPKGMA